jgi:ligand-binding sensor domain-containing protein
MIISSIKAQDSNWECFYEVGHVNTLARDGEYLWAGSDVGALKIHINSGLTTHYNKCNSPIEDCNISSIAIDNNGVKWMSTTTWGTGQLIRYDDNSWTVYNSSNSPLPGYLISEIAVDASNSVWLIFKGTNYGLMKFDGVNWSTFNTSNSQIPTNNIKALCCESNNVWVGGWLTLGKFDGNNWTVWNSENSNISSTYVQDMEMDHSGNIWLLNDDRVERFNGNNFTRFNRSNVYMTNLSIDINNTLWATCIDHFNNGQFRTGGLISFGNNIWTKYDTLNSEIKDSETTAILADADNNIWFGCGSIGEIGRKNDWTYFDASIAKLNNPKINQIVFNNNGDAFIGTQLPPISDYSLIYYDFDTWTGLPYYLGSNTLAMGCDNIGNLYLKNETGINKFDGSNWSEIPDTPDLYVGSTPWAPPRSLALDSVGGIWIDYLYWLESIFIPETGGYSYVTHEGLAWYNGSNWSTFHEHNSPLPSGQIHQIKFDSQGNTWISTSAGLIKFDGTNWTIYNASNSTLPYTFIEQFLVDSLDNIWLPDRRFGFYIFDGINTTHYTCTVMDHGPVYSFTFDANGELWQHGEYDVVAFDGINWMRFNKFNSPLPNGLLKGIYNDQLGNKWIGTEYGFLIYKDGGVVTSSETAILHEPEIKVFPNPANEFVVFEIALRKRPDESHSGNKQNISITDIYGRAVAQISLNSDNTVWHTHGVLPGVYLYRVQDGNDVITGKLIIVR